MNQDRAKPTSEDLFESAVREILEDRLKKMSLRKLADLSKVSVGTLSMFLSGKQSLSEKTFQKLKFVLGLPPGQARYLDLLRALSLSKSAGSSESALHHLVRHKKFSSRYSEEARISKFLSSWVNVAIYELAAYRDFRLLPDQISRALGLRPGNAQVKKSLSFLLKEGFLEQDPSGKVQCRFKQTTYSPTLFDLAMKDYHRQMLKLASEALDQSPSPERHVEGMTLLLAKEKLPEVRKIIENALTEIQRCAEANPGPCVYQVSTAVFKIAEWKEEKI